MDFRTLLGWATCTNVKLHFIISKNSCTCVIVVSCVVFILSGYCNIINRALFWQFYSYLLSCVSVQHECIPQAILGMDILCQAKSGMGKTAVFVLATLQQIDPVDGQVS